jgi:hypothetical protein
MDGAIAVLTLALVVITAYYAWQNRKMVNEMQLAREAASLPHLTLCFEPLGPMNVMVGLVNLGPGAAVAIDVIIEFHARAGADFSTESRRWRGELLASGRQRDSFVPDADGSMMSIQRLSECVDRITLRGSMQDVLGRPHVVDCAIGDLHEWDDLLRNARERYKEAPLDKLAKEAERLRKAAESAISKWSAFGGGLHVRTDADLEAERNAIMEDRPERLAEMASAARPAIDGAADVAESVRVEDDAPSGSTSMTDRHGE